MRIFVVMIVAAAALTGACQSLNEGAETSQKVATKEADSPTPKGGPTRPGPQLPPEPTPPVAHKAHEVPGLEAELSGKATYAAIWEPGHEGERRLLLTGLSAVFAEGSFAGTTMKALNKNPEIKSAVIILFGIQARSGSFPADFTEKMKAYLKSIKSEPRLGLWSPDRKGEMPHDYTALGAWYFRDRPEYIRERLLAKRHDSAGWHSGRGSLRLYLTEEKSALKWLARLTKLTGQERARLEYLELPSMGQRIKLGGFAYVIDEAKATSRVGTRYSRQKASEGAAFIVVKYSVENLGSETKTVLADDLILVDYRGRKFSASAEATTALAMSGASKDLIVSALQPGLKRTALTAFEVPADVAGCRS